MEEWQMNIDMGKIGDRIAEARKKRGFTQEKLADEINVTVQAVSKWENGKNLPDLFNLFRIAEVTDVPYSFILDAAVEEDGVDALQVRDRLFHEDNMFTRIRSFAQSENLRETYRALQFIRDHHAGQFRDPKKYSTVQVLYINHPLLMACQAHALGIRDDQLLAAILLHDIIEDTDVKIEELPFSDGVRELVSLVTKKKASDPKEKQTDEEYYKKIKENGKACVIKLIDRCNNVSTMAGSFDHQRMKRYILETEKYVLPLADNLKRYYPEYSDLAFLVNYQIVSVLETVKSLIIK